MGFFLLKSHFITCNSYTSRFGCFYAKIYIHANNRTKLLYYSFVCKDLIVILKGVAHRVEHGLFSLVFNIKM